MFGLAKFAVRGSQPRFLREKQPLNFVTRRAQISFRMCARHYQLPLFLHNDSNKIIGTTILSVRKDNKVVVIGDGQVTYGATRLKSNAKKVRKLYNDSIIVGMAGATADAFTLIERLEQQLDEKSGQLMRACVELAKMWRTDKFLRRLEAFLIVVDRSTSLTLTGSGEVIESEDGLMAIGSGGPYALAAARGQFRSFLHGSLL